MYPVQQQQTISHAILKKNSLTLSSLSPTVLCLCCNIRNFSQKKLNEKNKNELSEYFFSSSNNNKIIIITFLYSASYTHSESTEKNHHLHTSKTIIQYTSNTQKNIEDQTHFFFLSKKPEFNSFEFLLREARGRDFVEKN